MKDFEGKTKRTMLIYNLYLFGTCSLFNLQNYTYIKCNCTRNMHEIQRKPNKNLYSPFRAA